MTSIGIYSAQHAKKSGYAVYLTPDGREVIVTAVYNQEHYPTYFENGYPCPDKIKVGKVTKFIRRQDKEMSERLIQLRAVKDLIATRKNWTQGKYARDKSGIPVTANSSDAVCWCIEGACFKITGYTGELIEHLTELIEYLDNISNELFDSNIVAVNDDKGFEAIHKILDEAIWREENATNPKNQVST